MTRQSKNSFRLLYLSCARMPSEKAHAYQILKMCEAFTAEGAAVTLLYQRRPGGGREYQAADIFSHYGIRAPFSMKKLACLDLPMLEKFQPVIRFYITTITYLAAAAVFMLRHRASFDAVYCRDIFSLTLLRLLKPLVRIPVFYETHMFPEKDAGRHISTVKRADGIIVLTSQLGERFKKNGIAAEKIIVAHDAVDIEHMDANKDRVKNVRERLGIPRDAVVIGYVGRFVTMEQEKGITELMASMQHLGAYRDKLYMAFIGGPLSLVPAYEKKIAELGLDSGHFKFQDLVPVQEVPAWLAACDMLAMPFPRTPHYEFNMSPLKMFEYMAAAKPIIATRLPSVMEVLRDGENAVLAEPDSPEELAQGIQRLLDQPELCRRVSRQAREDVLDYTWTKRARRILQFMRRAE